MTKRISNPREGLKVMRLFMVMSSLSPLFILWAIRGFGKVDGVDIFPEYYFVIGCALLATFPSLLLCRRVYIVRKQNDRQELLIGKAEDHRSHLLVYLFAMLLPFYQQEISTYRDFIAMLFALSFFVFLFWHLNLHYLNFFFAICSYRVYTVSLQSNDNLFSRRDNVVLITLRHDLPPNTRVIAYRLSNSVFLERRNEA